MKNLLRFKKKVSRALIMLFCYKNWLVAIADRFGLIKNRPVLYRLRNGVSLLGLAGSVDVRVINEVWLDSVYDSGVAWPIQPDLSIVDLGANRGYFTVKAAQIARRIVAVEPNPESYALCKANIVLNGLGDNIQLRQVAVAEEPGQAFLYLAEDSGSCSTLERSDAVGKIIVDAVTMVDLVADWGVIDLLKMDIEGSELKLLLAPSSKKWLHKVNRIVMEYHTNFYSEQSLIAIRERLKSSKFKVVASAERDLMFASKSSD